MIMYGISTTDYLTESVLNVTTVKVSEIVPKTILFVYSFH